MPGCSKRYTDPSSLRKHVKNHSVRDTHAHHHHHNQQQNASTSVAVRRRNARAQQLSLELPTANKTRRFSDSAACSLYATDDVCTPLATPCTAFTTSTTTNAGEAHTHFSFADCFGELAAAATEAGDASSDSNAAVGAAEGSMSFHALSDCIVTIQNSNADLLLQQQQQQHEVHDDVAGGVGVDEYVSFECVKKLLLDETAATTMDYNCDPHMQSAPFDIDYFNGIM